MSEPVSTIRNLGPASEEIYARAGIKTADELRSLGAHEAYRRLLANGTRPHFIGFYALVMGLQGRPWNDCQGSEKAELRRQFDAMKASIRSAEKHSDAIDAALDAIGVIER